MRKSQADKALKLLKEVKEISRELPRGKANKVINRCDKVSMIIKKTNKSTL